MRYRRAQIAGDTYFFTVALAERKSTFLIEQADGCEVIRVVKLRHPFEIVAMVMLLYMFGDCRRWIWTIRSAGH